MADDVRDRLTTALSRLLRVKRRLAPLPDSLQTATRKADRTVLANGVTSARMDLSVVIELLEEALDVLEKGD